jgi:GTP cyclohydrolase II/3,4-dihydroxy 2-butanone 4-phosphate synthase/GTP cyclohydrolase II
MTIPKVDLHQVALRNRINLGEVERIVSMARQSMKPIKKDFTVRENSMERTYTVTRRGVGRLQTASGLFWQLDFFVDDCWGKYSVIVCGDISNDFAPKFKKRNRILMRIDSGCESGQRFSDITCDCRDQLMLSLQEIAKAGEGIVINIPYQDGRGMGNYFKLATLSLQERLHLTTVEAASVLTDAGLIDKRTYAGVVAILRFLQIAEEREIGLLTNNPHKLSVFEDNGYRTITRIPMVVPPTRYTQQHLESKQIYLDHKGLVAQRRG